MLRLVAAAFLHFVVVELRSLLIFASTAIYIMQEGASYTHKVLSVTVSDFCFPGCTIQQDTQNYESLIQRALMSLDKSFSDRTDCASVEYYNTNYGTFMFVLCILVILAAVLTGTTIFVVEARSVKNLEMFSGAYFVFTLKLQMNKIYKTLVRGLLCVFVAGPVVSLMLVMYVCCQGPRSSHRRAQLRVEPDHRRGRILLQLVLSPQARRRHLVLHLEKGHVA